MERHAADVIIGMMKLFLFFVGILGKMFRWCCPVYIIQRTKNNNVKSTIVTTDVLLLPLTIA